MPSERPSSVLESLDATQRIFNPCRTRSPSALMNITDVEPVPRPTRIPSATISAARLPTSAFASSCVIPPCCHDPSESGRHPTTASPRDSASSNFRRETRAPACQGGPMASSTQTLISAIPASIQSSCEFVQALMHVQRTAQLITSTLDLDHVLDRAVNDLAETFGNVEVCVWLREPGTDELVHSGVHGCSVNHKGTRLKFGKRGMVAYVASTGVMRYAPDVRLDPYYLPCEPETLSA